MSFSTEAHCKNLKFSPNLPMTLLLVLWFCCIRFTNQEMCHSPGDLPAPQIFLDKASNKEEDAMVLKCKVPPLSPFTRIIFCKDGKDIASQPMRESKFAYDYKVKANSAGRFTCLYQHKDNQNQEKNSLLSATQNLSVTECPHTAEHPAMTIAVSDETPNRTISGVFNGLSSKLILGITIPSLLVVVVVVCSLLARKVPSKWRDTRKHSPREKGDKSPEDQLQYATIVGFPRASITCSQPSRDMAVTYATIGHCMGQQSNHLPSGETDNDLYPYDTGFGL